MAAVQRQPGEQLTGTVKAASNTRSYLAAEGIFKLMNTAHRK